MRRIILGLVSLTLFLAAGSCYHPAKTSQENGQLTYTDFLHSFPAVQLPFQYNEDSLIRSMPDSLRLDAEKLGKYIPDSIWYPEGRNHARVNIYPVGQHHYGHLYLLFIRTAASSARKVDLLIYGEADTLITAKEIALINLKNRDHVFSFHLDDKYLLNLNERKELDNGHVIIRERVYGINPDGSLVLILTNTNEPASANSFYNPIDTLPARQRYSGDYSSGKSDIVSIRDGEKKGTFHFFIHLNKNEGDCTGELDGTGKFTGKHVGEFHEDDGPCAIRFSFSSDRLTLEETGGCGAYRGISCYFNGTYLRKKTANKKGK